MRPINVSSTNPTQIFNVKLLTGDTVYLKLMYRTRPQYWFLDVAWGNFTIRNVRISGGINLLEQYKNNLPFGIVAIVSDGYEPFLIGDFFTGRVVLYILDQPDLALIAGFYAQGVPT